MMTKTKKSRDGILPITVKRFGSTDENTFIRGFTYCSNETFFLLSMDSIKEYTIDLHTHSITSYDGGINAKQFEQILTNHILDFVAITDHNQTHFAEEMHKKFGEKIIVGEEIMTTEGEIIGLFLTNAIPSGGTAQETIESIHQQGGLVYIPHPFETIRKGVSQEVLQKISKQIDIMEVFNARAFLQRKSADAYSFASKHALPMAASSDAHGVRGLGSAYTTISGIPTAKTLTELLHNGSRKTKNAPLYTLLYPTVNKIKRRL